MAALLENIQGEEGSAEMAEVVRVLRAEDEALLAEPSKGLCRNFKRLRQAFYKEKYRGRRRAAAGAAASASPASGGGSGTEEESDDEGDV